MDTDDDLLAIFLILTVSAEIRKNFIAILENFHSVTARNEYLTDTGTI